MNDILFKLVPNWPIFLYFELSLFFVNSRRGRRQGQSRKRKIEIGRGGLASIDNGVRSLLTTILFYLCYIDAGSRVEFHVQDIVELFSSFG